MLALFISPFCFLLVPARVVLSHTLRVFSSGPIIPLFEVIIQYIIIKYNLLNDKRLFCHIFLDDSSQNSSTRGKHFYPTIVAFEMELLFGGGGNIPVDDKTSSQILRLSSLQSFFSEN